VCGGAEAFAATTALLAVWVGTKLQHRRLPGIKKICFFLKEVAPFWLLFPAKRKK
jgi:hypothetical protein